MSTNPPSARFPSTRPGTEAGRSCKLSELPAGGGLPAKVSKGFRRLRSMFRCQRGLCSLCCGPMELVNFTALSKQERKRYQRDTLRYGMSASIDHTLPYSQFRGVSYNRRAAHRACNEIKGDALIEPYPLPCYSDMSQLPRIKLARGRFIEMVAP